MKKIEIEIPDGKRAEWINGVLTLVDEPKPESIMDRVKTFEDALNELDLIHPFVNIMNMPIPLIAENGKTPTYSHTSSSASSALP